MKCPFLHFESACIGHECPLCATPRAPEPDVVTAPPAVPEASCALALLTGFLFAYRKDRTRLFTEIEDLGKRIGRKIDEHDAHLRHHY